MKIFLLFIFLQTIIYKLQVVKKQLFDTTDSSTDQSQLTKLSDEVFKDDLLQTSSNHAAVSSIFLRKFIFVFYKVIGNKIFNCRNC